MHDGFGIEHSTLQIEGGDDAHPCGLAPSEGYETAPSDRPFKLRAPPVDKVTDLSRQLQGNPAASQESRRERSDRSGSGILMTFPRRHHPGVLFALAFLLLLGVLPASPGGVWVCPNGALCPWMNRGEAMPGTSHTGATSCRTPNRLCCRCPADPANKDLAQGPQECRYLARAQGGRAPRLLPESFSLARQTEIHAPSLALDDLLALLREPRQEFLPPEDFFLPSSPPRGRASSRAPPLTVLPGASA